MLQQNNGTDVVAPYDIWLRHECEDLFTAMNWVGLRLIIDHNGDMTYGQLGYSLALTYS